MSRNRGIEFENRKESEKRADLRKIEEIYNDSEQNVDEEKR